MLEKEALEGEVGRRGRGGVLSAREAEESGGGLVAVESEGGREVEELRPKWRKERRFSWTRRRQERWQKEGRVQKSHLAAPPPLLTLHTVSSSFGIVIVACSTTTFFVSCSTTSGSTFSIGCRCRSFPFPLAGANAEVVVVVGFFFPPGVHPHPPGAIGVPGNADFSGLENILFLLRSTSRRVRSTSSSSSSELLASREETGLGDVR